MLLLDWLLQRYPAAKRQTLKRMLEERRVRVNGKPATRLKQEISATDVINLDERAPKEPAVPAAPFPVVYEDPDILVVDKPAGLLTSTVPREPRPTLLAMVRQYVASRDPAARVGLIHRLDRDASGLLVFSKNTQAYESLKKQLAAHSIDRIYTAIIDGSPPEPKGRIRSSLVELPDGSVRSTKAPGKGQHALTEYLLLKQSGPRALLRVTLHTGRKHQIRAHLSERGMPIVNDPVYRKEKPTGRLMLAATSLALTPPRTRQRLHFEIPIPPVLKHAMKS